MTHEDNKQGAKVIDTTVGDLIATISEIALKAGKTEEEGYKLASLTLQNILKRSIGRKVSVGSSSVLVLQ